MKRTNHVSLRLTLVLVASAAYAQAGGLRASADPSDGSEIAAARRQYTQTAEVWQQQVNTDKTLAQLSRRGRGTAFPPRRGNPNLRRPQPRWMDHGDASHAVVGAAIGFGLGALAGAKFNTDQHSGATAGAVVIFGAVGALIGGLIGESHGGMHSFAHRKRVYPPSWPKDEDAVATRNTEGRSGPLLSSASLPKDKHERALSSPH